MDNKFTIAARNIKFFESSDALKSFHAQLRQYRPLTAAEQKELVIDYRQNGNQKAKETLMLSNQAFVYSNAKRFARDESELIDYVNEGMIGLSLAIDSYDINAENGLLTWAVWYIRRQMNSYMNNTRDAVIKSNNMKIGKKIDKIKAKFYTENGYYPDEGYIKDELLDVYGIEVKDNRDLFDVNVSSIDDAVPSCDEDLCVEESGEFAMETASYNTFEAKSERLHAQKAINNILKYINHEDKDVIKKLYGIGTDRAYTVTEVAEMMLTTPEDIQQIRDRILRQMRRCVEEHKIAL